MIDQHHHYEFDKGVFTMKNKFIVGIIITFVLALWGCGQVSYPDLPDHAIAFEMGTFEDKENNDTLFSTIEYNGRTYIGYGTINNSFTPQNIDKCIGYIIQDENSSSVTDKNDKGLRVYTLVGDTDNNFLMDYDDSIKLMNQPSFWRALDTKGKDIEIPSCIDELGYEFWENN